MKAATAFETLVQPHLGDLRRYCYYLTKSRWDADDLYQEALTKAFVYVRSAGDGRVTKPFLFRAAKLSWIDAYRKGKSASLEAVAGPGAVDEGTGGVPQVNAVDDDYAEIRGLIEWLAERLPAKQLDMWLLAAYFGYSMQDVAEHLNTSLSAVKSSLFRTKRLLRSHRPDRLDRAESRAASAEPQAVDRWVREVLREEPRHLCLRRRFDEMRLF